MKTFINTLDAILAAAVLTVAPLVYLLFWDFFTEPACLKSCDLAPRYRYP
jgi:hypothetical protein